ncbi:hypothetical protein GSI_01612 [Ganoderma sinense ZZ0214-1]|uniref:Uncharacterized protein n=1 Tax=Ganoderma sinense ZZ0214-1 TaxID=1077348 RepID=A0A2G8SQD1_9APHY|nr:hypothetical protein GSI_01612 [Ganoderma sinense ZZ0214-1]
MTLGPPPSAAGPSSNAAGATAPTSSSQAAYPTSVGPSSSNTATPSPNPSIPANAYMSQFVVQPQPASRPYYPMSHLSAHPVNAQAGASQPPSQPYPAQGTYYPQQGPATGSSQPPPGSYSYYGYPSNAWANAWNSTTYQFPSGGSYSYSYPPLPQAGSQTAAFAPPPVPAASAKQKSPSPSPSPPPEYHKDWDAVIKSFLSSLGLSQALRGFEADMVVLNPDCERKNVPQALGILMTNLLQLGQAKNEDDEDTVMQERPLEERKLDHVHLANGVEPRSNTSITKDISRFLAQNRARNDASNRNEFLLSIAEKRRRLNENGEFEASSPLPSCARTDAKTQNRDLQMKYDIVKNEDGPLRRTMKPGALSGTNSSQHTAPAKDNHNGAARPTEGYPSVERYPALDERLQNVEKHFAVRYVPSPPRSLLDRLKYLEDHIIHLEKEYPPWAALHFNQPNRGWPPPPRATPIIVPSHLTSANRQPQQPLADSHTPTAGISEACAGDTKVKLARRTKSSLHRAVMEKLEVQKAMNDLAGDGG